MLEEIKYIQIHADCLFDVPAVESALDRMATQINLALADNNPLVLCALNGGIIVAGHLLAKLTMPLTVDAVNASRYRGALSGGDIQWLLKPKSSLQGRTVLLIDDILDEGITLAAIATFCREQGAAAVYTAVLADKDLGKTKPIRADFVGLTVPNRYVFGYGMDYKGYLRNAPGIFACNFKTGDAP